ncbi:MAG: hypothetical protein IPP86_10590 [Bacteroidetes bacterium]|nr:hypothetical protein [Bacteroidota bacterium]
MMKKSNTIESLLESEDLVQFRTSYLNFENYTNQQLSALIEKLRAKSITKLKVLMEYHDLLLFCLAHPRSEELRSKFYGELERISEKVKEVYSSSSHKNKVTLSGSGISGSAMTGSFSFELVQWLNKEFPNSVKIDGVDNSDIFAPEILRFGLLPIETDLSEKKDLPLNKWLTLSLGNENKRLEQILSLFDSMKMSQDLRDYLYDSLKLFIDVDHNDKKLSRTFGHIQGGTHFYQKEEFIKKPDFKLLLQDTSLNKLYLNPEEKQEYVDTARIALCTLFRETDPVTFADVEGTEVYSPGRGLTIALYSLRANRRLPLDAYVGYMAFKNGLPCAYGGGWIFRHKSKIGINIFPPYRGGESAWIYSQIIRLYHHRFNANVFEAEPYQIGKNNPEGIQSGAFWFYYRLGFRPVQNDLYELANSEWKNISADKKYRTSSNTLKKLANSNLRLDALNPGNKIASTPLDAQGMGNQVTQLIRDKFKGNRKEAESTFQKYLNKACPELKSTSKTPEEKNSQQLLLPLSYLLSIHTRILEENKKDFMKWTISKSGESESNFIECTQKLEKYFMQLDKMKL